MTCRCAALTLSLLLGLTSTGLAAGASRVDLASALARLSADSAAERASGERELALALGSDDGAKLAEAVRAGSAEVRARIASALMSDARHLALAAELAAANDALVARTGDEALAGLAATWLGASDQEPLPMTSMERTVRGGYSGLCSLDISRGELEPLLDQLARLVPARRIDRPAGGETTLVLDPGFDPRQSLPLAGAGDLGPVVVGSLDDLVYAVAVTHGAVFDVYGWNDGRTWIVVRPRSTAHARPAQALLRAWILEVQQRNSPRMARGAARALASCGWPAALEWLELRWNRQQDAAAFDGLLLAAGRGRLARSLESVAGARELLARADRALAGPEATRQEMGELARALLAIGISGAPAWAEGFAAAPERGRLLRCALVAGARAAPADLVVLLRARLASEATSSEERCALLRALASIDTAPAAPTPAAGLDAAFIWALEHDLGRDFPSWVRRAAVLEPTAWKEPRALSARAQQELCADALSRAGESPAGRELAGLRLASLLAQPQGEASVLALLDRESPWIPRAQLRDTLDAASEAGGDPESIARLMLSAGLCAPEEQRARIDALFERKPWSVADWHLAAAAIAKAGGVLDLWPREEVQAGSHYALFLERLEAVREQLLAASTAGSVVPGEVENLDAGWVQACERTLRLLRERQSEPGAREFLRRLRVLFQRTNHPLRRELSLGRFPPPSAAVLVAVEPREPWIGF